MIDYPQNSIQNTQLSEKHWRVVVAIILGEVVFGLIMFFPAMGLFWFPRTYTPLVAAYLAGFITISAVLWVKPSTMEPWVDRERWCWLLIGIALIFWGIGESKWQYYILIGHNPFPSTADIGYTGMTLLVFLGLFFLPSTNQPSRQWLLLILDSFIVTGSLLSLAWFVCLGPLLQRTDLSEVAKFLSIYYPVIGILLLSFVVFLLMRGRNRVYLVMARRVSLLLLGVGLCSIAFSDFSFDIQENLGTYQLTPADIGWPLGMLTISLGAYLRCVIPATPQGVIDQRMRTYAGQMLSGPMMVLPYALLAILFIVFSITVLQNDPLHVSMRPELLIAMLIMVALVVFRQIITLYENALLTRRQAVALEELLRAKQHIEAQTEEIIRRNTELLFGIEHLKGVHARLANGNWWVRSTLTGGDLLPLSTSLNLLAERLQHLKQAEETAVHLSAALNDLATALARYRAGGPLVVSDDTLSVPQIRYILSMLALPSPAEQNSSHQISNHNFLSGT